jgi:hypothetical protein
MAGRRDGRTRESIFSIRLGRVVTTPFELEALAASVSRLTAQHA